MNHAVSARSATGLQVEVVTSLAAFSDAELDRVTRSSCLQLSRPWLRLVDAIDLQPLIGETVQLRYVIARRAGELIGLCPFFIAAHPSVRFANSFEKAFFTGLKDELLRGADASPELVRWLMLFLRQYRRLLHLLRIRTDGWLLAVSPLSFRGGIPTVTLDDFQRRAVQAAIIARLKQLAAAENLPLCLMCVPGEDEPLRQCARAQGLEELFLSYDLYIPLPGTRVDDFLAAQTRKRRARIRNEMKHQQRNGVTLQPLADWNDFAPEMTRMYENVYAQYGEHFSYPPALWRALSQQLGAQAQAIVARKGDETLGFTTLLHDGKRDGDLMVYRIGRRSAEETDRIYFDLVFYEPLRRAYALGCKRLWVGAGAFAGKLHRGAVGHPLFAYMWLPTPRARLLLLPYLRRLTNYVAKQLEYVGQPHKEGDTEEANGDLG
jgi:predicted N-acyltransferase